MTSFIFFKFVFVELVLIIWNGWWPRRRSALSECSSSSICSGDDTNFAKDSLHNIGAINAFHSTLVLQAVYEIFFLMSRTAPHKHSGNTFMNAKRMAFSLSYPGIEYMKAYDGADLASVEKTR